MSQKALRTSAETGSLSAPIRIPKGAVRMNLSPDDIKPRTSEPLRNSNDNNERVDTKVNESYFASIHIPSYVYWARVVSPSFFPELVVFTP